MLRTLALIALLFGACSVDDSEPNQPTTDVTTDSATAVDDATAPVDVATDTASAPDAGTTDAGPTDAAPTDAAPTDAGATDASNTDTSNADTSNTDTSNADTSNADTVNADTAVPDTAPPPECVADGDCQDDGDLCNGTPACVAGKCVLDPATIVTCDASGDTTCAINTCDAKTGACALKPSTKGTPCDDGDTCTISDACAAGVCVGKSAGCQCKNTKDCKALEDGNLCNGTLYCDKSKPGAFVCAVDPKTVVTCDSAGDTTCTKNTCAPTTGQCKPTAVADGKVCDDGDLCTAGDKCKGGACVAGVSTCECKSTADCASKEDGDLCNGTLYCDMSKPGAHVCALDLKTVVKCNQSTTGVCEQSVCVAKTGACATQPVTNGKPCDDGDACTAKDSCVSGKCKSGSSTCECKVSADCASKEDGNLCNGTLICDTSKAGQNKCVVNPATVVTCNQSQTTTCTKAVCAPSTGKCNLQATNNGATCNDGDPCTGGDVCKAGVCKGPTNTCTSSGPTWAEVYQKAFSNEGCGGCHGSYSGKATTYATLTQQSFCGAPLVVPGNPSKSSIVWKVVQGVSLPNGCGKKMPKKSPGISSAGAKLLQDWIKAGAKP